MEKSRWGTELREREREMRGEIGERFIHVRPSPSRNDTR